MIEVNKTTYGDWIDYVENDKKTKSYKCSVCKNFAGQMKTRTVTEVTGGAHKEYKVVCSVCGHQCCAFWNKLLAERTWEAENDSYYEGRTVPKRR